MKRSENRIVTIETRIRIALKYRPKRSITNMPPNPALGNAPAIRAETNSRSPVTASAPIEKKARTRSPSRLAAVAQRRTTRAAAVRKSSGRIRSVSPAGNGTAYLTSGRAAAAGTMGTARGDAAGGVVDARRGAASRAARRAFGAETAATIFSADLAVISKNGFGSVSYTHLRAHETRHDLV